MKNNATIFIFLLSLSMILHLGSSCMKEKQLPSLTTSLATSITSSSATCGGDITWDGGDQVTARGVCWGTKGGPSLSDYKTTDGTGSGNFISTLTLLNPNTNYYVRAYATNSIGTAYGNDVSFKTTLGMSLATVTTNDPNVLTSNVAILGGNVTADGNAQVSERGIVYATTQTPTTSNTKVVNGGGLGTFSGSIQGLTANTTYYVRAYALNSQGTSYGNQLSFNTPSGSVAMITDFEGNGYKTVTIGTQTWMAENLKTTTYKDGSAISNVTGTSAWSLLTTGAYCWNNNDITNKTTNGALYNWYAWNSEKLCPLGWHVPKETDWRTLINYIGGISAAGTRMKSSTGWLNNGNGSNSSEFSAFPAGARDQAGVFEPIGNFAYFWSSTDDSSGAGVGINLSYNTISVGIITNYKRIGMSVRCVKD